MFYILQTSVNWEQVLIGDEDWSFLWEIILRTIIMTILIVLALRLLGKRGVKQLSVFELVVIISFGSAAGDPMIYKEIGVITAALVFTVIISVYKLITYLIGRYKAVEDIMEGKPMCLIRDGKFEINNFKKEALGSQELLSELRLKGVSQLGQVENVIEEVSGELSVFFFPDAEVKYGLPIMPDALKRTTNQINKEGYYSCNFCGYTEIKTPGNISACPVCKTVEWMPSSDKRRVN